MSRFADKIGLQATLVIFVVGTIVAFAFGAILTAVALHLSVGTIKSDWRLAKAWLMRELTRGAAAK